MFKIFFSRFFEPIINIFQLIAEFNFSLYKFSNRYKYEFNLFLTVNLLNFNTTGIFHQVKLICTFIDTTAKNINIHLGRE